MSERKHPRVVAAIGCVLSGDTPMVCMTKTISEGGLFFKPPKPLALGSIVEGELVRGGLRAGFRGRIVSVKESGVGVMYEGLSAEQQGMIRQLIAKLLAQPATSITGDGPLRGIAELRVQWANEEEAKKASWWRRPFRAATLVDLSLDGAAIVCRKKPAVGERVVLRLGLEEENCPECLGEVVRLTERGFALRLINPSLELRRWISDQRRNN